MAGEHRPRWVAVLLALCAGSLTVAVAVSPSWTGVPGITYVVPAAAHAAAVRALATLPVTEPAPMTGYDRALFGQAWADTDRDGCDTRNDVLARDLAAVTLDPGSAGCVVVLGTLPDPYSGTVVPFERGPDSARVQVDHVVALADAWAKGASGWTAQQREAFANDPANLLAVDGGLNQDKGAGDAATWLPPNTGYRCVYVLRQVLVKAAYGLSVTASEHAAMERELGRCVTTQP